MSTSLPIPPSSSAAPMIPMPAPPGALTEPLPVPSTPAPSSASTPAPTTSSAPPTTPTAPPAPASTSSQVQEASILERVSNRLGRIREQLANPGEQVLPHPDTGRGRVAAWLEHRLGENWLAVAMGAGGAAGGIGGGIAGSMIAGPIGTVIGATAGAATGATVTGALLARP